MGFEEPGLFLLLPPLVVEPSVVDRRGEAAGVGCEVGLDGLEGRALCSIRDFRAGVRVGSSMYRKAVLNEGQEESNPSDSAFLKSVMARRPDMVL